jgi:hypothetical protein
MKQSTAQPKSQIIYPGIDNIPVRLKPGQDILEFSSQAANHVPKLVYDAAVKVFDLSLATDLAEYRQLVYDVANQRCVISQEDRQWNAKKANFVIFVRWMTPFWELRDRPVAPAPEQPPVFNPSRPISLNEAVAMQSVGENPPPPAPKRKGIVSLSRGKVKHERKQKLYS